MPRETIYGTLFVRTRGQLRTQPKIRCGRGGPSAGHTVDVAKNIAASLRMPVLSKDIVKEALFDTFGLEDDSNSQAYDFASLRICCRIAALSPVGAVLEAWFGPQLRSVTRDLFKSYGLAGSPEIWCFAPAEVILARFTHRAPTRHPGHRDFQVVDRVRALIPDAAPLAMGPTLWLDTTKQIDFQGVVEWVRDKWAT